MRRALLVSVFVFGVACGGAAAPTAPTSAAPPPAPAAPSSASSAASPPAVPTPIRQAVDAPDRSADDRALDEGRRPAELFTFFGVSPGMRVAELGAGRGYTAELLARIVGEKGQVYGHNTPFFLQRFAEAPWSERLKKPVMARVVRVDREFEAPLPPEAQNLDLVCLLLAYHDTVWLKVDREKLLAAVFAALKPGGLLAITDHSAKPGAGLADVERLHRIEETVVRREIEAAGFVYDGSSDLLRTPSDTRDWNASPSGAGAQRGTSDRFALRFLKPRAQ
jgi:predicted methyltransferase